MTNLGQIFFEAVKLIMAGIVGGLIGARANDRLTRHRERDSGIANRRRDFLVFLATKKAEIGSQEIIRNPSKMLPRFNEIKIEFRQAEAMVSGDIPTAQHRKRLKELIDATVNLADIQAVTHEGIKHILDRIEETENLIRDI